MVVFHIISFCKLTSVDFIVTRNTNLTLQLLSQTVIYLNYAQFKEERVLSSVNDISNSKQSLASRSRHKGTTKQYTLNLQSEARNCSFQICPLLWRTKANSFSSLSLSNLKTRAFIDLMTAPQCNTGRAPNYHRSTKAPVSIKCHLNLLLLTRPRAQMDFYHPRRYVRYVAQLTARHNLEQTTEFDISHI